MRIVVFGLSLTSSWGNGHATTYRALLRGLASLGHQITFCERDLLWYAKNRDLPSPDYASVFIYADLAQAKRRLYSLVRNAGLVIVGSYVPQGSELGEWVTQISSGITAFYDIDTPVTLAKLETDSAGYINRRLVPRYDLYLSFTGGPKLRRIESRFGARMARPLYCSVDLQLYSPAKAPAGFDLGYMGTYSEDRQPSLETLLLEPARRLPKSRMIVAGPQYPKSVRWPRNVKRITHLSPDKHPRFFASQRFTLNLTREQMRAAGYSPSVRLFEAAACGTPIITDDWLGLDEFFKPGEELLVARSTENVTEYLHDLPDAARLAIGERARSRVLRQHTAVHRALELETYLAEADAQHAAPEFSHSTPAPASDKAPEPVAD